MQIPSSHAAGSAQPHSTIPPQPSSTGPHEGVSSSQERGTQGSPPSPPAPLSSPPLPPPPSPFPTSSERVSKSWESEHPTSAIIESNDQDRNIEEGITARCAPTGGGAVTTGDRRFWGV